MATIEKEMSSTANDESIDQEKNQCAKFNLELLRQLKQNQFENLKHYTGFGGRYKFLVDEKTQAQLKTFLTETEIEKLIKSTRTGYFTPEFLVKAIYEIVQKLGFKPGKILEPACGHGAFFQYLPTTLRDQSTITGIELEPLSANIAKALYPDIRVLNEGFHHFYEKNFDLIVGNPPYAPFPVFDPEHADLKEMMIHHYFVAKAVRLLKPNGLLAMVVPSYILDNPQHHVREQIAEVAELVTAYRLPDSLFANAKVTVDCVVFKRTEKPNRDWIKVKPTQINGQHKMIISQYFIDHPDHILGQLDTYEAYSKYEDRPRRGLRCVGSIDAVKRQLPQLISQLTPLTS